MPPSAWEDEQHSQRMTREDVRMATFVSESSKNQISPWQHEPYNSGNIGSGSCSQRQSRGWPLTSMKRKTQVDSVFLLCKACFVKKREKLQKSLDFTLRLFWCNVLFCPNSVHLNFVHLPAIGFETKYVKSNLVEIVKRKQEVIFSTLELQINSAERWEMNEQAHLEGGSCHRVTSSIAVLLYRHLLSKVRNYKKVLPLPDMNSL